MKHSPSPDEHSKFSGNLRHYHRSSAQRQRTWDEWVEGPSSKVRTPRNWLKIIGITVGVLALAGIIAGLVIELG